MLPSGFPDDANRTSPLRLLVVDDDDVDRERVRRMLGATGFNMTVTEAASAREAIACLGTDEFDCLFLDYQLGETMGTDLLSEIDSRSGRPLPVVLVTGAGDERLAVSAMQQGVYDYIPKTQLRADLLGTVLTGCLRRANLEQQVRTQQERLEHLSMYDGLTGLPNRNLFLDRLEQELRSTQRAGKAFAVLLLDLDMFKDVNDSYGHAAGDTVLRTAAQRTKSALRDSDTVARLGGDEFSAILMGTDSIEGAMISAEKIIAAIAEPIVVGEHIVHVGVSIGIALYPAHGDDTRALLANADRAMYRAKDAGHGYQVYREQLSGGRSAVLVASRLKQAIERRELFLDFQPIINLATRRVVGAEALVRWRSPEQGVIPPAQFIPVAERSAIIRPLSYAVIEMALDQASAWRAAGRAIPISVNLSARLIEDDGLPGRVLGALNDRGLPANLLTLEITETALMASIEHAKSVLGALSGAGVRISIDDFGAGFTSFKFLREFEVSEIKIDRMFTADLLGRSRDSAIVQSIALLTRGFGVPATAEGIEDPQLCGTLLALGCNKGQGFGIAHPMPGSELPDWLDRWEECCASTRLMH